MNNLVIVESPSKARKISGILGHGWNVLATIGHIKDLPLHEIGVDTRTMEPHYVLDTSKKRQLGRILSDSRKSKNIYIASDADREGESIGYHIYQYLVENRVPASKFKRVELLEITRKGIEEGLKNVRELDVNLVEAQQTRRVLDRIVGYTISPILWESFNQKNLAAGRVQNVALMLLVELERLRRSFKPEEYWLVELKLANGLVAHSKRLEKHVSSMLIDLIRKKDYQVNVFSDSQLTNPPPPCNTASMIRDANIRWGLTSEQTMAAAQELFRSQGRITYHRTDSFRLAMSFVGMAKKYICDTYGAEYHTGRSYGWSKGAHEAVRPTTTTPPKPNLKQPGRGPRSSHVEHVYEVIWRRAITSQMSPARIVKQKAVFRSTTSNREIATVDGGIVEFDGFRIILGGTELVELDKEGCKVKAFRSTSKFSEPPRKYTEADLVKALEDQKVGRPSTYASIFQRLTAHSYIKRWGRLVEPTIRGEMIAGYLEQHFNHLTSSKFTAEMESRLDAIAEGGKSGKKYLKRYYTKVLSPLINNAKTDKSYTVELPKCNCSSEPTLKLVVGIKGNPYLVCPSNKCKSLHGIGFEGNRIVVFRSKKVPGKCRHCGNDNVLQTGQSKYGVYTFCSLCGKPDRDLTDANQEERKHGKKSSQ